jgi:uroporphyrin-III C-methyltransferase/precorrin-2 dehydrogenase/sirohydrochlorin ferrochelatase
MRHFPVFLSLAGRRVLLVGAGAAAEAKERLLAAAGAEVVQLAHAPDARDFAGFAAVFVAVDDAGALAAAERARGSGVHVNVVDRPELSTFIVPSIVDRGDIVVAVGTGGASPVLARRIRARIEAVLPARIGALAGFLGRNRKRAEGHPDRRALWEAVVDGPAAAAVLDGDEATAQTLLDALLASPVEPGVATVTFIPEASDDPDDLTLRAFRALQDADLLVHAAGTASAILDRARRDARRTSVAGPAAALLRAEALEGRRVVRLCPDGATLRFEERALRAAGIPTIVAAAPHLPDSMSPPRRVRPFQMAG